MGEGLLVVIIVAIIGLCAWAAIHDTNEWKQFSIAHHCRVVGQMDGSTAVGPSIGGKGGVSVVYVPGKTGWLCDDGITYWR